MTTLKAPIVNPADKYTEKSEQLHKYGQYLMSCLPKYIQQCVHVFTRPLRDAI